MWMLRKSILFLAAALVCVAPLCAQGQTTPGQGQRPGRGQAVPPQGREDALDPTPINPAVDPNVDMFIGDWRSSKPRTIYGHLVFRDILTKLEGPDPLHPTKRGAVLQNVGAISYAMLQPGAVASGRVQSGERQTFYTAGGAGKITVNSKSYDLKEGSGFALRPDFGFRLTSQGKVPLAFYVRTDSTLPTNAPNTNFLSNANNAPNAAFTVTDRHTTDRSLGIHWAHIGSGGLITIAPRSIPQPHSHYNEEIWIMIKGETVLSIGKNLRRMVPGQAYRAPPTGITAHTNINMGKEPVQMMVIIAGGRASEYDYAQLDGRPFNPATDPDVDQFMGNWRDTSSRIMHGNLYFRDMLTALQGPDSLHPTRKGAVLVNAEAISYAMLEPGFTAHKIDGQMKGIQQIFVVNSGTGTIASGGKTVELAKGMSFIITPGLDFRLMAAGENYLTFYVVSEKLPEGFTPAAALTVVDNRGAAQIANSWVLKELPLITKADGLSQYKALILAEMSSTMAMSRPYSADKDVEEIWIATDGDIDMLFGKQLRKLPGGTAYRVPSTGITAHAKINVSGRPAEFIYMVK
jgi:mannose-6-phosphate isomerase-like protein (cupin superfamily)